NDKDIQDIPPEVRREIKLIQVEHMDEVLEAALVKDESSEIVAVDPLIIQSERSYPDMVNTIPSQ
ncbi:MAG: S16 family serine protease, partial [Eubacteriales bacterium]|nr:S16 family serine protease [Eubacteriales bacterium]